MITLTKWLQRKLVDELIFSKGEYEDRKHVRYERYTLKGQAKAEKEAKVYLEKYEET